MAETNARRRISLRLCLVGIVSLGIAVPLLCFHTTRMAGGALVVAALISLLRSLDGPVGFVRSTVAWLSGVLVGATLSMVPVELSPDSPGVVPAMATYLTALALVWIAFSHERQTPVKMLVGAGAALGMAGAVLLIVGHAAWLPVAEYIQARSVEHLRESTLWEGASWWDHTRTALRWLRVAPLLLALLGMILLRMGLAKPLWRAVARPATAGVVLGVLAGAVVALLLGSFDLRQRVATLAFDEGAAFRFTQVGSASDSLILERAVATLRRRLDPEPRGLFRVTALSDGSIRVGIQGRFASDPEAADIVRRVCEFQGLLEFRILAEPDDSGSDSFANYIESLKARGPQPEPREEVYQWFEIGDPEDFLMIEGIGTEFESGKHQLSVVAERFGDKYYVLGHIGEGYTLTHRAGKPEWSLKGARPDRDYNGRPAIQFTLDEAGGEQFATLTRQNIGRQLAIFLDNVAMSHAGIRSAIDLFQSK